MRYDTTKYRRVIFGLRTKFGIEVLELYLLAPEVVRKSTEL